MRKLDVVFLDEIEKIARSAGELIKAHYCGGRRNTEPRFKSARQVVTRADRKSERLLRHALLALHPCAFHGEESGGELIGNGDQWVVDPLDGTENLGGYPPLVGISIGLVRNGQPVLGVIFDPIHDLLYRAREGGQATENGKRMRVSAQPEPDRALIGLDFSSRMETRPLTLAQLACVLQRARAVKVLGAPALSLAAVASGRLDLFFRPASKPADLVAGACLVMAAGGEVMDFGGTGWTTRSKGIIAGPGRMVEAYLSCFSQAGKRDVGIPLERG